MLFEFGMKALPKILLALTGVTALSLAYPASVQAVPTKYQYTDNLFTFATGPYTTSIFVTVMMTLADPLEPNFRLRLSYRVYIFRWGADNKYPQCIPRRGHRLFRYGRNRQHHGMGTGPGARRFLAHG